MRASLIDGIRVRLGRQNEWEREREAQRDGETDNMATAQTQHCFSTCPGELIILMSLFHYI